MNWVSNTFSIFRGKKTVLFVACEFHHSLHSTFCQTINLSLSILSISVIRSDSLGSSHDNSLVAMTTELDQLLANVS